MIELQNDIAIRCNDCGELIYIAKEGFVPEEYTSPHSDNGMGDEIIASVDDSINCPSCGKGIRFHLSASLYAYDIYNSEPIIHGGQFVDQPTMVYLDESAEASFVRWAYNNADEVQKMILDIASNRAIMYQLDPRDFEYLVERIYKAKGFRTQLTQQTRDGGKDIIAYKNIGLRFPIKIFIECKRFAMNRAVGASIIRDFYGTMTDANINRGLIVTSSYFSQDAYDFVKRHGLLIELTNGNALYKMIVSNAVNYYESLKK